MSAPCQRAFSITVAAGGGPPNGPLQLDATTVGLYNGYTTWWGTNATLSGLLQNLSPGTWGETGSDNRSGFSLSWFVSAGGGSLIMQAWDPFGIDVIEMDYAGPPGWSQNNPTGLWTKVNQFPGGFVHPPPGWNGPPAITVSWA